MTYSKEADRPKENGDLKVAVDVAIFDRKGRILLGKRLAEEGFGTWGFPGGRMNPGEKAEECAQRELKEELGNDIEIEVDKQVLAVRENKIPPNFVHHVTIILKGKLKSGQPKVMEPDRCSEWRFIDLDDLSKYHLFSGVEETLRNFSRNEANVVTDWQG